MSVAVIVLICACGLGLGTSDVFARQLAAAGSGGRVALVIGNSRYASVAPLVDPQRDAMAVASVFEELGFSSVTLDADLTRDRLLSRLKAFGELAENAEWAVIYYAGHGLDQAGRNYVVPVDARLMSDADLSEEAVSLDSLIAAASEASKVRMVIVDASRNNPFLASMVRKTTGKAGTVGLGAISPEGGVAVVSAAKAGELAQDGGKLGNSPFARSLIKALRTPGVDLESLFQRLRNEVIVSTAGRQSPVLYGDLPKQAYFSDAPAGQGEGRPDDVAWDSLGGGVGSDKLLDFTRAFPKSPWSPAAYVRLAALQRDLVVSDAAMSDSAQATSNDAASATPLTISCGTPGVELTFCQRGVELWSKSTGKKVKVVPAPDSMDDRLNVYRDSFERKSADLDIVQIDVTWSGMLAEHLVDLYAYSNGAENGILPPALDAAVVDGRLVAIPWFVDSGLLFYRKDLLKKYGQQPPQTWEQLAESAAIIQKGERKRGIKSFNGFLFNGLSAEGLTCFALEMVNAYGGAISTDQDGRVSIDSASVEQALETMTGWIGKIAPKQVVDYNEEAARQAFQNGNAAYMRNWPYALYLAEEKSSRLRGKVGVVSLPRGGAFGNRSGVLGGWQLAVSNYSRHRKDAASLVMFLTSAENQKERAIEGGFAPAVGALYSDPEVLKANALFPDMYAAVTNAIVRPSRTLGQSYDAFTAVLREEVARALAGQQTPENASEKIAARLATIPH
ncbi:MAG: extracellular solute-binding protein [Rhizobiaceae bacterium]|nr:extracellular solute-binding protein [Rhizobiaceae bacterium]